MTGFLKLEQCQGIRDYCSPYVPISGHDIDLKIYIVLPVITIYHNLLPQRHHVA